MPKIPLLRPYWQTSDEDFVRLYLGDAIDVLRRLPERSVQTVVTSPPYWGLRDYGIRDQIGSEESPDCLGWARGTNCGGVCHVCKMRWAFAEIHRVLRNDGTVWLNYGDSYASGEINRHDTLQTEGICAGLSGVIGKRGMGSERKRSDGKNGLPSGNLVGVPWRVALALQSDGWILRQDIIWHKTSPMPESVKSRCTKAHEYVFLLAKKLGYYYDAEAIKEMSVPARRKISGKAMSCGQAIGAGVNPSGNGVPGSVIVTGNKKNKRSVWTIGSHGYEGAHFAIYPPKLVEPCILAGTSEHGACAQCGSPWKRVIEQRIIMRDRPNEYVKRIPGKLTIMESGQDVPGGGGAHSVSRKIVTCPNTIAGVESKTLGWEPTCNCGIDEIVPCVILDPFIGSGTTAIVAIRLGRACWGIDLSETYLRENSIPRIRGTLIGYRDYANLAGPPIKVLQRNTNS